MSAHSRSIRRLGRLVFSVLLAGLPGSPTLPAQAPAGPVVVLSDGQLRGRLLSATGGAVFLGIPYAAPPVGELRWREPAPVKSWSGVRQAAEYGAPCAQEARGYNKSILTAAREDCLYLNVWTPQWPPRTRSAVMVWLHGGSNLTGSAQGAVGIEPPFDGASLASHDVVVVTINYRVGVFGFMGHPELTTESPHHVSGNYGLLDQVAALEWVRDNIARFGGDPARVTLFGQSAGGRNTAFLLTSPLARGLYHRAILQSGTSGIANKHLNTRTDLERLGVTLGEVLKAPSTGTVAFLRGLPASQIMSAVPGYYRRLGNLVVDLGVDGYVLPQSPPEMFRAGKQTPLPMIIGSNGRDGGVPRQNIEVFYANHPDLLERAVKIYGSRTAGPRAPGASSPAATEGPIHPVYGTIDDQVGEDFAQRCGAVALTQWHSAVAPTFHYEFTSGTAAQPPVHGAELALVFGHLERKEPAASVRSLSSAMQRYWTNFAKSGDPNGPGLPEWPKHDLVAKAYMDLGNSGPVQKAGLRAAACGLVIQRINRDVDSRKK